MKFLLACFFIVSTAITSAQAGSAGCASAYRTYQGYPTAAAFASDHGLPVGKAKQCGWSYNKDNAEQHAVSFCNGFAHAAVCKVISTHH